MIKFINTVSSNVSKFWNDEEGATAAEYGLILALIAVVIIGALRGMGVALTNTFTSATDAIH